MVAAGIMLGPFLFLTMKLMSLLGQNASSPPEVPLWDCLLPTASFREKCQSADWGEDR